MTRDWPSGVEALAKSELPGFLQRQRWYPAKEDLSRAERDAAEGRLAAWERKASRAFLDAYFETARGSSFCPADRADAEGLVRFFMLENALYEVAYELANRPDWVVIPLRGVLALLDNEADLR